MKRRLALIGAFLAAALAGPAIVPGMALGYRHVQVTADQCAARVAHDANVNLGGYGAYIGYSDYYRYNDNDVAVRIYHQSWNGEPTRFYDCRYIGPNYTPSFIWNSPGTTVSTGVFWAYYSNPW